MSETGAIRPRTFAKRTLLISSYLLLAAVPQWMLISIYVTAEHVIYTLIAFFSSFILLTIIHMSYRLKYYRPVNWICIIICFELMTLGMGTFSMRTKLVATLIVVLVAILIWFLIMLLCWFLIHSLDYPHPYKLAALAMLGLTVVILIVAIDVLYKFAYSMDFAMSMMLISVVFVMISHVLITYDSMDYVIPDDTLLVAFVLYMDYLLIVVACSLLILRIQDYFEYHF